MAQRGFGVEAYTKISQFYFFLKLRARRLLLGYAAQIRKFRSSTDLDKNVLSGFFNTAILDLTNKLVEIPRGVSTIKHSLNGILGVRCYDALFSDCKANSLYCLTASAGAISVVQAH